MDKGKNVLVVGAGIFGTSAALELSRRGYSVTLLNPSAAEPDPRASSTDISKIARLDYGSDELYTKLMEECLPGWRDWNRMFGQEVFHETGLLVLSMDQPTPGSFVYESAQLLSQRGHPLQHLGRDFQLQQRFPIFNHQYYRYGYYNPQGGWVESGKAVHLLLEKAIQSRVKVIRARMKQLLLDSASNKNGKPTVRGVETHDGQKIFADTTLISCGAWTPILLPHLRPFLRPIGQIVFHLQPPKILASKFPNHDAAIYLRSTLLPPYLADISQTGFYGFPAHPLVNGQLKIGHHGTGYPLQTGSEEEMKQIFNQVREKEENKFREWLQQSFGLSRSDVARFEFATGRMCLYCDSADGHFLIDYDPSYNGLMVAAGGSGHGFKFGPRIGVIISDILERKKNPYAERFVWRGIEGRVNEEEARFKQGQKEGEKNKKSAL